MSKIAKFNFITGGVEYTKGKPYTEDEIKDLDPSNFEGSEDVITPAEDALVAGEMTVDEEIIISPENEEIDSEEGEPEDKKKGSDLLEDGLKASEGSEDEEILE